MWLNLSKDSPCSHKELNAFFGSKLIDLFISLVYVFDICRTLEHEKEYELTVYFFLPDR
jgi:hypothetical protein